MSILVDENTRVLVQGITGFQGSFQTRRMIEYGTKIVGGISPGKYGQTVQGIPVFNTVEEAMKTGANTSIIYVPAMFAYDAILEASDSGIDFVVCVSEGVPIYEEMKLSRILGNSGTRLLGPNCPGIISPGKSKVGLLPDRSFKPGNIGIVSRSGTLTYQVADNLTRAGLGQSTVVGIGGDPMPGLSFVDILRMFEQDWETEKIVLLGEIGGSSEEAAAEYIATMSKPVVSFIAGRTAPPGKKMGHAGAIVEGAGTVDSKIEALESAGVKVARTLRELLEFVKNM